ncbi:MAG: DUF2974 domain-containing protein [Mogibacterium sp.]|nr:DUF2974 domain-containing protein [Mogibacterium sp.]
MADIFDYLEWRADVPLSVDPFNEVDNLVLAELAYADFDGILDDSFDRVPLKNVDEAYFAAHSRDEAIDSDSHVDRAPLLMDGMLSGRRFRSTKLTKYVNIVNADKDMQMSAMTFILPDGSAFIAFRGTGSTVVGWKEDFNMSYMPVTEGQRSAVRYLNEIGSKLRRPLRVGGHSKGGNFAVFASAFCDRKVQDRIITVYTNDGPGFRKEIMVEEGYKRVIPKVVSIVPDTSIIGMLLKSGSTHKVIKSSGKGIGQHYAFSWQVERNRFVTAEQSDLGLFIKRSQQDWLSKIDDESRESFVNTLFSIFEATGMDTFGEMEDNLFRSAERMLSSIKGLPKERQKELLSIFGELAKSGRQVARSTISDRQK